MKTSILVRFRLLNCVSDSICQVLSLYNMGIRMRQEKRHKLQLFYDIICAIEDDMVNSESARPTHVQHYSRLSYDKMVNYIDEMEKKHDLSR
jgi:predicted transcriptional regulator